MALVFIAVATFACTLLGGLFALRFKDRLHLVLGFSAGAVIGVAFFDLLPEALELAKGAYDPSLTTGIVAFGFIAYLFLDRFVALHAHAEEAGRPPVQASGHRGMLSAGSLSLHSLLDGAAIGLAFQVSAGVGFVVAAAVLVHDFSDGINTVNLILKNNGSQERAFRWLLTDASAPVIGMISTVFFSIPKQSLGLLLALFCGFFLYIGASDLLPESHHRHPTLWTTVATAMGMAALYLATRVAGL
jgi:ZIP family zinc transporter